MFLDVKFKGGLGNQLFQYATARRICIKKNIPYLLLNSDNYKVESLRRNFSLLNYAVKGMPLNENLFTKIFRTCTKANVILSKLRLYGTTEENGFSLQTLQIQSRPFISLIGYWQSEHYFKEIRQQLLQELKPVQIPVLPSFLKGGNTVAVHVRRTDYLTEPRYGFLGAIYYQTAMAMLKEKISNPLFIFFSDDIAWCKATFKNDRIIFCEDDEWNKDYLQLYLISKCAHQVIANSSFSWWGAWLNTNPQKIVIRPATPFKEKSLLYQYHYPAEWISVNNE